MRGSLRVTTSWRALRFPAKRIADERQHVAALVGGEDLSEGRHALAVDAGGDAGEQHVVALAEPGRVADEVGRREAGNTATAAVGLVAPTRGRCVAL